MIFAIVAPSASGKSTIERRVDFERIISYTTRPMRRGELDGVDYFFVHDEEFLQLEKKRFFTETASYREWHYGLSLQDYDYKTQKLVVVVTPKGYEELLEKVGDEYVKSVYIHVEERERMVRQLSRGDEVDEVIRRIHTDRVDFAGFDKVADYIIENHDLDKAIEMLYTIIKCSNK